ncbi:MAG TPA: DUF92 domain-containing protein [Gemmatimonadaceae bacterium]|nr:DUF92 domain-containing protein [Gemmatimonadaceae bacterium]
MIPRFFLGALLAAVIVAVSLRARLLSTSGAVAATLVGSLAVTAGWSWGILLVVFFALTAGLSAHQASQKREITRGMLAKDTARDAVQVLSNGGVFALAALAWLSTASGIWLAAGAGAIAAAAADTWATEIGIAFGGVPRSILSWKSAQAGTSGAITAVGSLGGLLGAAAIAGTVLIIGWPRHVATAAFFAGVSGMVIDSVLGATVQSRRHCSVCDMETEQLVHHCGRGTQTLRGVRWIDNDAVNTLATISGAMAALGIVLACG